MDHVHGHPEPTVPVPTDGPPTASTAAGDFPATVAPAPAPEGRRRSFAARFFGVIARPRTYLNLIYLLLAFPLGVFYFIFFVAMLSTAIGTIIVWVGIPLLALTAVFWWVFAAMERYLADGLLGTHLTPAPQPWRRAIGTWPRIKAHMGAATTWKDLAFLFVKFPLGIVSLVIVTVVVSVPAAFITAPLTVGWADWTSTPVQPEDRGFYIQTWHVDHAVEAIVLVPIGILLLFAGLHLVNGMAALWRMAAGALLETDGARRGPADVALAAPQAAPLDARPAAPLLQPPADWTPHYAPGAPTAAASYLSIPQPGQLGYPPQSATPAAAEHETAAQATEPSASPPQIHDPAPPRRPQPPKPRIWEEDDA